MDFEAYLLHHLRLHPSAGAQDILKFCYQRAFGAEHLLRDVEAARRYFLTEYEQTAPILGEAVEPLSDEIARVHFAPWKASGMDAERLFDAFAASARVSAGGRDVFLAELERVSPCLKEWGETEKLARWETLLKEYDAVLCPAVHHSESFRKSETPAYRIVKNCFLKDIL